MVATAAYSPLFLIACLTAFVIPESNRHLPTTVIAVFLTVHAAVFLLNVAAFLFTARDWRTRKFDSTKIKCWWIMAIVMTGGIGWVWYILKYRLWQHCPRKAA